MIEKFPEVSYSDENQANMEFREMISDIVEQRLQNVYGQIEKKNQRKKEVLIEGG